MCKSEKYFTFCTCDLTSVDDKNFWILSRKDDDGTRWVGTLEPPILLNFADLNERVPKENISQKICHDLNQPGAFDFYYIPENGDQISIEWDGCIFIFEFINEKFESRADDDFYFPCPSMVSLAQGKILKNW